MDEERIAELERENAALKEQVRQLRELWASRQALALYHKEWEERISAVLAERPGYRED